MPQKVFREFASAVSDTIYGIYLSICTHTADPNSFRGIHCTQMGLNLPSWSPLLYPDRKIGIDLHIMSR